MSTRSSTATPTSAAVRARRGHKERSKNFTELEKKTVLEQITRHRDVLRQGRSNNATNRSKQLVWSSICEEVNKRCGGDRPRTPAQVKMWYENYKKKCKMRAHDNQPPTETPSLLDGMLWQNIHPLDVKDEDCDATGSVEGSQSVKEEDCLPVNDQFGSSIYDGMCAVNLYGAHSSQQAGIAEMSNGRNSCNEDDTIPNVLEPQVQIIPQSPSSSPQRKSPVPPLQSLTNHLLLANPLFEQAQLQNLTYLQKLNELSNTPLNLSHLDDDKRKSRESEVSHGRKYENQRYDSSCEEEKLYFVAKRQHANSEHEARMKILNMELRQKEELFSLQKQLFLIELKLKMDFLEKASGK